eukprot:XP_001707009.1 Hypothetical protein GL50803_31773 [Giardia lamblia ATCC 50803]
MCIGKGPRTVSETFTPLADIPASAGLMVVLELALSVGKIVEPCATVGVTCPV